MFCLYGAYPVVVCLETAYVLLIHGCSAYVSLILKKQGRKTPIKRSLVEHKGCMARSVVFVVFRR